MKQFKAESKRLLDLMINSIYTNKEIFLRELLSNSSDALDKLHFKSLTDSNITNELCIEITADKELKTLTISDNGIGMTKEELESNLGTIAASGTLKFKEENKTDENLIGQFGVGFYSAFMVAGLVRVVSRAYGAEEAYEWTSNGAEGYDIKPAVKTDCGTEITLRLKDNDEDCAYDEYLSEYRLKELVKKYSDYIRYPIKMAVTKYKPDESDDKKSVEYSEIETLNSMIPIWKKAKAQVSKEDYEDFYKRRFHDYSQPSEVITASIEGNLNYSLLAFVPSRAPYDYYSKEYEKGLALYSNGVLIMDKCKELLPDYLGFIKGIVDSPDLSLNISREILQKDRQLKLIAQGIEKKIVSEFSKLLKSDREKFEKMFEEFAKSIKYGLYDNYGEKKDTLKDIVLFQTSEGKLTTFKEYIGRMKEGQSDIYYACGESYDKIAKNPQTESVRESGFEILYLKDPIDEFVLKVLESYEGKKFKSVADKDLNLIGKDKEAEIEKANDESKDLFEFMAKALAGSVKKVRISKRLKKYPVCLTSDSEVSIEMEKLFASMPGSGAMKADRVLEINGDHSVFEKLKTLFISDQEKLKDYATVLYNEALLLEGLKPEDPAAFAEAINKII